MMGSLRASKEANQERVGGVGIVACVCIVCTVCVCVWCTYVCALFVRAASVNGNPAEPSGNSN